MYLKKVMLKEGVRNKIFNKHDIDRIDIEQTIFEGDPFYLRISKNKYLGIGNKYKYITIIFRKEKSNAKIITAYQSSRWQIRLYKRKK